MSDIEIKKNAIRMAAILGELGIDFEFATRKCGGIFFLADGGDIAIHEGVCYDGCIAESFNCPWDNDDTTRFVTLSGVKTKLISYGY